jgi:hypothetical protein
VELQEMRKKREGKPNKIEKKPCERGTSQKIQSKKPPHFSNVSQQLVHLYDSPEPTNSLAKELENQKKLCSCHHHAEPQKRLSNMDITLKGRRR